MAQQLVVSGTVKSGARALDNVLLDVYEYNSPIQTLHTDSRGKFLCTIMKGKEYLLVFYQSGYVSQSISIYDSPFNISPQQNVEVQLVRDDHSPDGLYFKEPMRRITPNVELTNFIENKFSLSSIEPQRRADTVSVLLHRAEANQYILIANRHLNSKPVDESYSKQVLVNIKSEVNSYEEQLAEKEHKMAVLKEEEDKHIAASFGVIGDAQLVEIIASQKALAERLANNASFYLLTQQLELAFARLYELDALQYNPDKDTAQQIAYTAAKAKAVNARYLSMDANKKFMLYNKFQVEQYQEYIELLRYKVTIDDNAKAVTPVPTPPMPSKYPPTSAFAAPNPPDTLDNLSNFTNTERTEMIKDALAEDARFKNYVEHKEVRKTSYGDIQVKKIRIAEDNYEQQVDRKGNARYYKNSKVVTKLTFDFETTRKQVDVLETLKKTEKYK